MLNSLLSLKATAASHAGKGNLVKLLDEGQRRFQATLTHIMVNENGHEVRLEEARQAVTEFNRSGRTFPIRMAEGPIKTPSDLHPTGSGTIVGKAIALELVENDGDPRIDYIGEVYKTTRFTEHAYQLVKDKAYEYDSFEVDYEYGECSTCGQRFTNTSEICSHLTVRQNMVVGTDRGHVIMHGIIFKGVALLDRPGGDPRAKVRAVANLIPQEDELMDPEKKDAKATEAAPSKGGDETEALQAKVTELENQVKELGEENKALKTDNDSYKEKEREERVEKIVAAKEERGTSYDEKGRKTEVKRLMAKTDEQLADIEEEIESIPVAEVVEEPEAEGEGEEAEAVPPKAEASKQKAKAGLKAQAGGPATIPDPTDDDKTETAVADLIEARRAKKLK